MEDLIEKTNLSELKETFKQAYEAWRQKADTFGIRFDEVEKAWIKYVKARDIYINYRDKDLYR